MRGIFCCTFFVAFGFFLTAGISHAASLYIDPANGELNRGDAIELAVRLDVDESIGECVNAIDGVITYPDNIEPVDVSLGDSIFSFWVEQPTINRTDRTITFAGGIPNGYCGRVVGDPRLTNNIAKLIFRAPSFTIGAQSDSNQASINFTDQTFAYLNDGLGTQVVPRKFGTTLTLTGKNASGIVDPWREAVGQDEIPPEEFSIFLEREDLAFSGKYYISFNTTDKQTGIDIYQVIEEPIEEFGTFNWGRADAPWITARSPYVLEDQSLNSVVRVKAIDKAGNEYIATLIPDESLRTISENAMTSYIVFGVIALIVLGCIGVIIAFFVQRLKRRKKQDDDEESLQEEDDNLEEDNEEDYE